MNGGQCQCSDGYSGFRCRFAPCPAHCSDSGLCLHLEDGQSRCVCLGARSGEGCQAQPCDPRCYEHGRCVQHHATGNTTCRCESGWRGPLCQQRTCAHVCGLHGSCVGVLPRKEAARVVVAWTPRRHVNASSIVNSLNQSDYLEKGPFPVDFRCECHPGWTGRSCQHRICPKNCSSRGVCREDGTCDCISEDFFGKYCEHDTSLCPERCSGRGNCTASGCNCLPRFGGFNCALECDPKCVENGHVCVAGECVCQNGRTGSSCEDVTCDAPCLNDGICVNGSCLCKSPFSGERCQIHHCQDACSGAGECVDGRCVCRVGFEGHACERRSCPSGCNAPIHGVCDPSTGQCTCRDGYYGRDCADRICDDPCSYHGVCVNSSCLCDDGWTGDQCQTQHTHHHQRKNINFSASDRVCASDNDCLRRLGRGRCGAAGACECEPGFRGAQCEQKTCETAQAPGPGSPCSGRGFCARRVAEKLNTSVTCACPQGSTGAHCEILLGTNCPSGCRGHGVCLFGDVCDCEPPFSGPDCGVTRGSPGDSRNRSHRHRLPLSSTTRTGSGLRDPPSTHTSALDDGSCAAVGGCGARGVCVAGECHCENGWSGTDCSFLDCDSNCNGRGVCRNRPFTKKQTTATTIAEAEIPSFPEWYCECDWGWAGPTCAIQIGLCPQNCSGNGDCLMSNDNTIFCQCHKGYGGPTCASTVCSRACSGHGACLDGECFCEYGYVGEDCAVEICPRNCSRHGSCLVQPSPSTFHFSDENVHVASDDRPNAGAAEIVEHQIGCKCDLGWGGSDCSETLDDPGCPGACGGNSHGECVFNPDGTHVCVCKPGWMGTGCETPRCAPDECVHGTCHGEGDCVCDPGWRGRSCDIEVCPNRCSLHGLCVMSGPDAPRCDCLPGWVGRDCSSRVACRVEPGASVCARHGVCVGSSCRCEEGWFGELCDQQWCPKGCGAASGRGECKEDGVCHCRGGFYGSACGLHNTAACLVDCEKTCLPYKARGFATSRDGTPRYDADEHTVVYQTKKTCFKKCAARCLVNEQLFGPHSAAAASQS